MRLREKECALCGKTFTTHKPFVKYCSRLCRGNANLMAQAERRKQEREARQPVKKKCRQCGKTFPSTHGSARYCSDACKREAHRRVRAVWFKKVGLALSRGKTIRRRCKTCGKSFAISRTAKRYCSKECVRVSRA